VATKAFDGHICAETMDLIVKRQIVIRDESGKPVRYHPLYQLFLIPIKSKRVHAIIVHDCNALNTGRFPSGRVFAMNPVVFQ
jgi:hypothetical protein